VRGDARQQLAPRRRLRDEVVRPGGEGRYLALLVVARRDDEDGQPLRRRLRPQQAAQGEAVDARHLHVQQDQIARLAVEQPERVRRVRRDDDAVRPPRENLAERFARALVVVDDQQRGRAVFVSPVSG